MFKDKVNIDGSNRYKARLVAQGFYQKYESDYDLVARHTTLRALLLVAAKEKMKVIYSDAKTAFLNGRLEETIYMSQPPGYVIEGSEQKVCLLKRSLYGLKQSARVWNQTLH